MLTKTMTCSAGISTPSPICGHTTYPWIHSPRSRTEETKITMGVLDTAVRARALCSVPDRCIIRWPASKWRVARDCPEYPVSYTVRLRGRSRELRGNERVVSSNGLFRWMKVRGSFTVFLSFSRNGRLPSAFFPFSATKSMALVWLAPASERWGEARTRDPGVNQAVKVAIGAVWNWQLVVLTSTYRLLVGKPKRNLCFRRPANGSTEPQFSATSVRHQRD
jgi:hypothetical protein